MAAAQRALTKLGYGTLKSDGAIGPGTRQAIEKFERDRRLPVTGDLNSRTDPRAFRPGRHADRVAGRA